MKPIEIITALQFVDALEKEQGISISPRDVKIGRLEIDSVGYKESGYVCFYAYIGGNIYWLKAFKGTTERVINFGLAGTEVKEIKEYIPVCFFKSAYKNTTWKVNMCQDGIYLTIGKK